MADAVAESPVALEYAPQKPWRHRRLVRRIAIVAALVGLAVVAVRYGPALWRRAQLAYLQRKCMRYTVAPGTVVYTEDPDEAKALLAGGAPYVSAASPSLGSTGQAVLPTAARTSREWAKFDPIVTSAVSMWYAPPRDRGWPHAMLFLHERSTGPGDRRLVVVQYRPSFFISPGRRLHYTPGGGLRVTVVRPGPAGLPPVAGGERELSLDRYLGQGSETRKLRFFAGQPDPADPSRFTIDYEISGQRHTLVGKLDPKWDAVDFDPPDGPAVGP